MHKLIGVTELQRRFQAIFDEVAHQHVPYILARDSRPEAALIPYHDFVRCWKPRSPVAPLSSLSATTTCSSSVRSSRFRSSARPASSR